ncbi:protein kinase [Achlya hypogyna]|uniref:Protein kinase n=1 Tax=Achlya hypogyna TaxID=1202772 RepID=A0A1V9Z7Q4_ACHHY|nr:protein kinase [Achlya hypogyna]
MVLELMNAGNLRQYLDKKKDRMITVVNYTTLEIIWILVLALRDLHCRGVVHGDLKSLNVLLCSVNYIKLADFGISQVVQMRMANYIGTTAWTAPEVRTSATAYSYASDVYSLGVILTELVTLDPPSGLVQCPVISDNCPPWLHEIIFGCLQHDPSHRPTAEEIVIQLTPYVHARP